MIIIYYLLFFIAGIIFNQWLFPLLDSIIKTCCGYLEVTNSKNAVTITKNNHIMEQYENNKENNQLPVIGFTIPEIEEDDYEDD